MITSFFLGPGFLTSEFAVPVPVPISLYAASFSSVCLSVSLSVCLSVRTALGLFRQSARTLSVPFTGVSLTSTLPGPMYFLESMYVQCSSFRPFQKIARLDRTSPGLFVCGRSRVFLPALPSPPTFRSCLDILFFFSFFCFNNASQGIGSSQNSAQHQPPSKGTTSNGTKCSL